MLLIINNIKVMKEMRFDHEVIYEESCIELLFQMLPRILVLSVTMATILSLVNNLSVSYYEHNKSLYCNILPHFNYRYQYRKVWSATGPISLL